MLLTCFVNALLQPPFFKHTGGKKAFQIGISLCEKALLCLRNVTFTTAGGKENLFSISSLGMG